MEKSETMKNNQSARLKTGVSCKLRLKAKLEKRKVQLSGQEPSLVTFFRRLYIQAQHKKACNDNRVELLKVQNDWKEGKISRTELQSKVKVIVNSNKTKKLEDNVFEGKTTEESENKRKKNVWSNEKTNFVFKLDYVDPKLPSWTLWELTLCRVEEKIELFLAPKVLCFRWEKQSVTLHDLFGSSVIKKIRLNSSLDCFIFRFVLYFDSPRQARLCLSTLLMGSVLFSKDSVFEWSDCLQKIAYEKCSLKKLMSCAEVDQLKARYFSIFKRFVQVKQLRSTQLHCLEKRVRLLQRAYRQNMKITKKRLEIKSRQCYKISTKKGRQNVTPSFGSKERTQKEKILKTTKNLSKEADDCLSHEIRDLVKALEKQVEQKLKDKNYLLYNLKHVLSNVFPCGKLSLFGSCASNLELPESDIDCFYMHQGGEKGLRRCENNRVKFQNTSGPSLVKVDSLKMKSQFRKRECEAVLSQVLDKICKVDAKPKQVLSSDEPLGTNHTWERWPKLGQYGPETIRSLDYFSANRAIPLNNNAFSGYYYPQQYSLYDECVRANSENIYPQATSVAASAYGRLNLRRVGESYCKLTVPIFSQLEVLRNALLKESWIKTVALVKAKIPVLRIQMCRSSDFERHHLCGKCLTADLSNGHSPGHTKQSGVRFLNEVQKCFPHFRQIMLLIKKILIQEQLQDPFRGGLGSFPLACLIVAFLRSIGDYKKKSPEGVSFPGSTKSSSEKPQKRSLGQLFLSFLKFYGSDFDCKLTGVSVRGFQSGHSIRHFYTLQTAQRYSPIVIDSPFWPTRNIASGCFNIQPVLSVFKAYFQKLSTSIELFVKGKSVLRAAVPFRWGHKSKAMLLNELESKCKLDKSI